jgi:hypothetical protein
MIAYIAGFIVGFDILFVIGAFALAKWRGRI